MEAKYLTHGDINLDSKLSYYSPESIEERLRELMAHNKCHRVWVVSYWHNDRGTKKMGLRYHGTFQADFEVFKEPYESLIRLYQDLFISAMWEEFQEAKKKGFTRIFDSHNGYNGFAGRLHRSRGVRAYYALACKREGEMLCGIGCDWDYPVDIDANIHKRLKAVRDFIRERIKGRRCDRCRNWHFPRTEENKICDECQEEEMYG